MSIALTSTSLASWQAASALRTASTNQEATEAKAPPPPPPPPPPADMASDDGTGDSTSSGSSGFSPPSLFQALISNDDTDGDGMISLEEAEASPVADLLSADFETIDADGDGLITEEEMTAFEDSRDGDMPPPPPPPEDSAMGSLLESIFAALTTTEEDGSVSLDADAVAKFQSLLSEIS